jgi:hypothetical protein
MNFWHWLTATIAWPSARKAEVHRLNLPAHIQRIIAAVLDNLDPPGRYLVVLRQAVQKAGHMDHARSQAYP